MPSASATGVTRFAGQPGRLRNRIRHDQETLERLEPGLARGLLAQHVEATVRQLVKLETDRAKRTNDWTGVGLAIAFMLMAVGLAVWTVKDDWSIALQILGWAGVVVLALFGVVGLSESGHKKPTSEAEEGPTT